MLAPGLLIATLELDDPAAVRRWVLWGRYRRRLCMHACSRVRCSSSHGSLPCLPSCCVPAPASLPSLPSHRRAEPFTGAFPELGPPVVESEGVGHRFRVASEAAANIMAGYHNSPDTGGTGGWGWCRGRRESWMGFGVAPQRPQPNPTQPNRAHCSSPPHTPTLQSWRACCPPWTTPPSPWCSGTRRMPWWPTACPPQWPCSSSRRPPSRRTRLTRRRARLQRRGRAAASTAAPRPRPSSAPPSCCRSWSAASRWGRVGGWGGLAPPASCSVQWA